MTVPLAYKAVAIATMLLEINHCAHQLKLLPSHGVTATDIRSLFVYHPDIIGFAGRLDTEDYSFCFAKSGRLRYITKLNTSGGLSPGDSPKANLDSILITNTNDAYRISTNWLHSIEVDVSKLEKNHPVTVRQRFAQVLIGAGNTGASRVPVFDIKWGSWHRPAVIVCISGATGELLTLRQEDDSYSKRPASLISNIAELLAIPDSTFLAYSVSERSNLISRFSAVTYHTNETFRYGSSKPDGTIPSLEERAAPQ